MLRFGFLEGNLALTQLELLHLHLRQRVLHLLLSLLGSGLLLALAKNFLGCGGHDPRQVGFDVLR